MGAGNLRLTSAAPVTANTNTFRGVALSDLADYRAVFLCRLDNRLDIRRAKRPSGANEMNRIKDGCFSGTVGASENGHPWS